MKIMEKPYDPFHLEEKLEHKLSQGEYIIPLVMAVMLWTAGLVDLLTYSGYPGPILGLYSIPYFLFILLYAAGFAGWWALIAPRDSITWVKNSIAYLQRNTWAGLAAVGVCGVIIFTILEWETWLSFPLLATAILVLVLIIGAVLLLARPEPAVRMQGWRKAVLALIGLWVIVEVALQVAAALRVLPLVNLAGQFVSHGRIYQIQEGFADGPTNRYGWYYPEFNLDPEVTKIVLTGNSHVQALQVNHEQHMGVLLEELINDEAYTVMALGYPDYGLTYAEMILYPFTVGPLKPNEVVIAFHLANDIQTTTSPEANLAFYVADENGVVNLHPGNVLQADKLWHASITGYEPLSPILSLQSQLFTLRLLDDGWRNLRRQPQRVPMYPANVARASDAEPFGASSFAFERDDNPQAEQARTITTGLLKQYKTYLAQQGITLRLVTIPYFPEQFYTQNSGQHWSTEIGRYDLLKPERELAQFAADNGIAFLPMGEYMQASGLSVEDIQGLYFKSGVGHFTPIGHQFFAGALYACFYGGECPLK
ncbi:MAG: hypothetical protein ACT4QE_03660 [Anaerolineales bacterium]